MEEIHPFIDNLGQIIVLSITPDLSGHHKGYGWMEYRIAGRWLEKREQMIAIKVSSTEVSKFEECSWFNLLFDKGITQLNAQEIYKQAIRDL